MYEYQRKFGDEIYRYQFLKLGVGFQVWSNNVIIGTIAKHNGVWVQTGGREVGNTLLKEFGTYLDGLP